MLREQPQQNIDKINTILFTISASCALSLDTLLFFSMENLDKMFDLSVYITDLSMHDVSRDLILVGAQQSRELAELLSKVKCMVYAMAFQSSTSFF